MARRLTELLKPKALDFIFSSLTSYPTVQEILSAPPSKYTWNLMFIHHFLRYESCSSNNLLTDLPDFNLFNPAASISLWEQNIMLLYKMPKASPFPKSLYRVLQSSTVSDHYWPLPPHHLSISPSLTVSQPHGSPCHFSERWRMLLSQRLCTCWSTPNLQTSARFTPSLPSGFCSDFTYSKGFLDHPI